MGVSSLDLVRARSRSTVIEGLAQWGWADGLNFGEHIFSDADGVLWYKKTAPTIPLVSGGVPVSPPAGGIKFESDQYILSINSGNVKGAINAYGHFCKGYGGLGFSLDGDVTAVTLTLWMGSTDHPQKRVLQTAADYEEYGAQVWVSGGTFPDSVTGGCTVQISTASLYRVDIEADGPAAAIPMTGVGTLATFERPGAADTASTEPIYTDIPIVGTPDGTETSPAAVEGKWFFVHNSSSVDVLRVSLTSNSTVADQAIPPGASWDSGGLTTNALSLFSEGTPATHPYVAYYKSTPDTSVDRVTDAEVVVPALVAGVSQEVAPANGNGLTMVYNNHTTAPLYVSTTGAATTASIPIGPGGMWSTAGALSNAVNIISETAGHALKVISRTGAL